MLFKKLMSEYAYRLFVGILFIKIPFLNAPWLRPIVQFILDKYVQPVFAVMGTYIDFRIIDYEKALQVEDLKQTVLKIKEIDESEKPLEDYDPAFIQSLRDEFHSKMDAVIKQSKSYN